MSLGHSPSFANLLSLANNGCRNRVLADPSSSTQFSYEMAVATSRQVNGVGQCVLLANAAPKAPVLVDFVTAEGSGALPQGGDTFKRSLLAIECAAAARAGTADAEKELAAAAAKAQAQAATAAAAWAQVLEQQQRRRNDKFMATRQVMEQPRVAEGVTKAKAATLEAIRMADLGGTKVSLRGEHIGDEGATLLGTMMKSNATVTELDLVRCAISNEGADALAKGLSTNTTVKKVLLGGNLMGKDAKDVVLGIAKANRTTHYAFSKRHHAASDTMEPRKRAATERTAVGRVAAAGSS
jgi:hypothetical protein